MFSNWGDNYHFCIFIVLPVSWLSDLSVYFWFQWLAFLWILHLVIKRWLWNLLYVWLMYACLLFSLSYASVGRSFICSVIAKTAIVFVSLPFYSFLHFYCCNGCEFYRYMLLIAILRTKTNFVLAAVTFLHCVVQSFGVHIHCNSCF